MALHLRMLRHAIERSPTELQRILDEVLRLPIESPYVARDLDTWDDYRKLHKEVFGQDPPNPGEDPGTGPAGS